MRLYRGSVGEGRRKSVWASRITALLLSAAFQLTYNGPLVTAGQVLDRPELKSRLRQLWDSLDTLEYRCESYKIGYFGRPDEANRIIYENAIGPQGRWASKVFFVKDGNASQLMQDIRADGKREIVLQYIPGSSEVVEQVRVSNLQDRSSVFGDPMNEVLWLFVPGGKPLHERLDRDVELSIDDEKRTVVGIDIDAERHVNCSLDPARDWLPTHVHLRAGEVEVDYDVERFGSDNGRWFPVEGRMRTRGDREELRHFVVTSLRINRGIKDSAFTMPDNLEKGVAILDQTSKVRSRIVGGEEARNRFVAKYGSSFVKQSEGEPLVAPRDPPEIPLSGVIATVSLLLILIAATVHFRGKRSS